MLEALVDVALRAIFASIVLGGVLALAVFVATRTLALTATTRHALWTTALIATALMPLAGVAESFARGVAMQAAVTDMPPSKETSSTKSRVHPIAAPPAAANSTHAQAQRTPAAPTLGERLQRVARFADWTPRLSRAIALGVVGVWAIGVLIGLGGLVASVIRVRGLKKRSSPLDSTLAQELPWLTDVGPGREIWLRLSYETETPVAIGFRRPVILIPTELATADGLAAIEPLILHEHAHLRRYDDWTNLAQRTIERIFWFNPIVWLVGKRIALEREIASDDAVVEKTGAAHAYATSLWQLAREMRMPQHSVVAPGALLTRKQISIRIEQLLDKNRARLHRSPATALGVVIAGVGAVAFVASSAPALELPEPAMTTTGATAQPIHHIVLARPPRKFAAPPHSHAFAAAPAASARPRILVKPMPKIVYRYIQTKGDANQTTRVIVLTRPPAPPPPPPAASIPALPAIPHDLGDMVSKTVHDAMGRIPADVAQEMSTGSPRRRSSLNGAKPTRELIAQCIGCSLRGADLRGIDLHGLTLNGDSFRGADLSGANLSGARLIGVSLNNANLNGADLREAVLNGVELRGASFANAQLEGMKLIGASLHGVDLRGTTLRSVIGSCVGCDFSHLDLHGQDLHGITLNGADLSYSDLSNANLSNVRFTGVDLSHTNLAGADLSGAILNGCDLTKVDLHSAKTTGMTLHGTDING